MAYLAQLGALTDELIASLQASQPSVSFPILAGRLIADAHRLNLQAAMENPVEQDMDPTAIRRCAICDTTVFCVPTNLMSRTN